MTAVILLGQLTFSALAAYAFASGVLRGRDALFWVYVATLMVPGTVDRGAVDDGPARPAQHVLGVGALFMFTCRTRFFLATRALSRLIPDDLINAAPRRCQH